MKRMMNKNLKLFSRKKGVTLLELLVTLSLISFLLVMGLTAFTSSTNKQYANEAALQINYAMKKAKYYARAKGLPVDLEFNQGSNTYALTSNDTAITQSGNFDATSGVLPDETEIIQNTCGDIYFNIEGKILSNDGNTENICHITVGYNNGPQKTLVINRNTGAVTDG
jgi:prepilin-type N-terminal cleavage/methylation domain-containing protein